MSELLALEVFFALLLDLSELSEKHLVTLFFISDLRLFLFLCVLKIINQLLLHGEFFHLAHLVVNLRISFANKLFLACIVRLLDLVFLINSFTLELSHAHLVLTDLLVLIVNLLLKHSCDLCLLIVVLFDLLPCHTSVGKELLKAVGTLL